MVHDSQALLCINSSRHNVFSTWPMVFLHYYVFKRAIMYLGRESAKPTQGGGGRRGNARGWADMGVQGPLSLKGPFNAPVRVCTR